MKRLFTTLLVGAFLLCGVGCNKEVADDMKTYILSDSIFDMQIEIKGATVELRKGEEFYVESNLKNLTVDDEDGCLTVIENGEGDTSGKGKVYIYTPDITFASVHAVTGAGNVRVAYLSAQNLFWTLGAGEIKINELYVEDNAEIIGGLGKLTVLDGVVNNLDMSLGVCECNFTAELTGNNTISCGVGNLQLNLAGLFEDYCVELQAGLGGATVDGKKVQDGTVVGSGDNFVDISGGVGGVAVCFIGDNETIGE